MACPEGHQFPVVRSIPRFVGASSYADHFGAQWNHYRLTQLDSHTGVPITENRMHRCIGEDLWNDLSGKSVLECGCGAGRFTEVLLKQGATVTSIDLSAAVDANAINCPVNPQHRIAQADILNLPFTAQAFDVVFCLGVVQHTPNPEQTIKHLYEKVIPGGTLVIDHYQWDWAWYTRTAPLVRILLKRLPPARSLAITSSMVKTLLPLFKWAADKPLIWSLFSRLFPLWTYYRIIPELPENAQREWAMLDTHDALTDYYKHFRTPDQIRQHLEQLGGKDIWINSDGYIVEARCRRPAK
jgi:2-polyprenyl-3-methyl-5-hydroxy-6-metoxy-1,4-benzoquinol methylase